jgi:hypothetical protein
MIPSTDLHQLIRSLDKKEKAYFKLISAEGADYVRLFDAIVQQRVYDEAAIKTQFTGEAFLRRFAPVKNYLFHQVLESLARQHNDVTMDVVIREQLRKVELLLAKGLRKTAHKLLIKARKLALMNDLYLLALQAIAIEKMIIRGIETTNFRETMKQLLEEEAVAMQRYQNLSAYIDLDSRIFHLRKMIVVQRSAKDLLPFREILNDDLLRHENKALSREAKFLFHRIKGICLGLLREDKKAMLHRKHVVDLFATLPAPDEDQVLKQSSALYDLAVSQRTFQGATEALQTVARISNLAVVYPQFMTEKNLSVLFKRATVLETDFMQYFGLFEEGLARLPQLEKKLKRFSPYIESDLLRITHFNIALILYGAEQPRKALRWLNAIIHESAHNVAEDVVCFSLLLRIVIQIDLRRDDLIESLTRSAMNYLQKRKRLYKAETLFLDFANQYSTMHSEKAFREGCAGMQAKFEKLFRNALERKAEEYFDFISWFESKANGKKFATVYRQRQG